jgi:hypothetical protein
MNVLDHLLRRSPRVQRTVALLVVPLALLLIWGIVIWPVWRVYQSQRTWRTDAASALARHRGLIDIEDEVRVQLNALPDSPGLQKLYRVQTPGAAVLALQSDISAALSAARTRAQTFTPLPPAQIGSLQQVGLRVVATMRIDQLSELLRQVDQLPHFLRFQQLLVNAPVEQLPDENPTLVVTLDIVGFAISGEG